jgi:hypothetical protein
VILWGISQLMIRSPQMTQIVFSIFEKISEIGGQFLFVGNRLGNRLPNGGIGFHRFCS